MDRLAQALESLLDRFLESGSIDLVESAVRHVRKSPHVVQLSIPKESRAREIRRCWEANRRAVPRSGIIFPEGSIMTVLFECCELPLPKVLQPIEQQISFARDGIPFAFLQKYSYCFYPNSEAAEFIGYCRYDFHSDSMGDGDLGEHTYFHMHHRQVENGFRLATGPISEFDKIVSGIEKVLAPTTRKERLERLFDNGKFQELLFDLTVNGIVSMADAVMEQKSKWKNYKHKDGYEKFVEHYV